VSGTYVVGYTGVGKRNWMREENRAVSSTFSVWRVENPEVLAVTEDPTSYGAFQNEIRISASSAEPVFIAYQRVSNVLWLYSIGN
jgi:hypothetical protein